MSVVRKITLLQWRHHFVVCAEIITTKKGRGVLHRRHIRDMIPLLKVYKDWQICPVCMRICAKRIACTHNCTEYDVIILVETCRLRKPTVETKQYGLTGELKIRQ